MQSSKDLKPYNSQSKKKKEEAIYHHLNTSVLFNEKGDNEHLALTTLF